MNERASCPICAGAMPEHHASLPLQAEHRSHLPAGSGDETGRARWESAQILDTLIHAANVMAKLEHFGPGIVPHLMDTDDNEGEYLRRGLLDLGIEADWKPSP